MPTTTVHKSTLRRYDGENWNPVYLATSADIVQIGEPLTVMGPGHGIYADGENIPANEPVATIIKKLVQTRVPPEYKQPTIELVIEPVDLVEVYEIGTNLSKTVTSKVSIGDAGAINAHTLTQNGKTVVSGTDSVLSHALNVQLTENVTFVSECSYDDGEVKQDNFNDDSPVGNVTVEPVPLF